ncbi:MAG: MATE family efflux transporter [Clostridiales bacterium]|nr:MATE family efflux transporter [Clostridiales bacterium]
MNENKMGSHPINKILWTMGLPMVFSMVLQALYNVVDTVFVINMGEEGIKANLALTYVFPIQIFMIAVGVGTGIGINALLSRALGEGDKKKIGLTLGNGIFVGTAIYIIFLLFGLFASKWFLSIQTNDVEIINIGTEYLKIVTILSFGAVGFNVFERFLQATGKTQYSTIAQVAGAVTNIILDYIFIYPCKMGVAGAAYATIIGQIVSLLVAVIFHYFFNREIKHGIKDMVPNRRIIGSIYRVGWSAMLMQALLSINMFVMIKVFSITQDAEIINGTYGIYYKIQQIALFSCFGLSNTIISLLAFNVGLGNKERIKACIKWGIIDTIIVAGVITIIFELFASPIANLFGLTAQGNNKEQIVSLCQTSIRIASIGYVFMAISLAIQGILQAYRKSVTPLFISLLRLIIIIVPIALIFINFENAKDVIWWAFPITEILTAVVSLILLKFTKEIKEAYSIEV